MPRSMEPAPIESCDIILVNSAKLSRPVFSRSNSSSSTCDSASEMMTPPSFCMAVTTSSAEMSPVPLLISSKTGRSRPCMSCACCASSAARNSWRLTTPSPLRSSASKQMSRLAATEGDSEGPRVTPGGPALSGSPPLGRVCCCSTSASLCLRMRPVLSTSSCSNSLWVSASWSLCKRVSMTCSTIFCSPERRSVFMPSST
mmetsp:Transcript_21408/g.50759  ORF Transcript_21408/g.50759 Transcript_21408/m.50759 type:complete len:201 (+) Transcript_21408:132-734(+)